MSSRYSRGAFFVAFIVGLCSQPVLSAPQEAHEPHWAYTGTEDPPHWAKLDPAYAKCSLGRMQSPIHIKQTAKTQLPALKMDYKPVSLNIVDNGHTVQVNVAPGSTLTVGDKAYTLKQFHFHHPSEEYVNGKGYPLVAHLVHADADGHLAVVAVLFEKGTANSLIATLWKNIPPEKEKAQDLSSISIRVDDLLPTEHGYFTYTGSLTTPPCTEGVAWYVLKSHSFVSAEQVATFSKIYPGNARSIQPTNGREVLETK